MKKFSLRTTAVNEMDTCAGLHVSKSTRGHDHEFDEEKETDLGIDYSSTI